MITFHVPGTPKPQGSKVLQSAVINGQTKSWMRDADSGLRPWRDQIRHFAKQAMIEAGQDHKFALNIEVSILFIMKRTKGVPVGRTMPNVKPDIDKLSRAVLDAMEGVCYENDSRVVELQVRKVYETDGGPQEGALISVGGFDNDSINMAWDNYKKGR
jgi:Holliday junction resolvase RusA-like endonuclease